MREAVKSRGALGVSPPPFQKSQQGRLTVPPRCPPPYIPSWDPGLVFLTGRLMHREVGVRAKVSSRLEGAGTQGWGAGPSTT